MENVLNFLQQLDLSEIEAKLYLNLLKSGPASVRDLAETIEIKRTTAYFYIDQLIEKGLVTKVVKGSKKMIAANSPESLEHLVENKVASAKLVQQNFPSILTSLTTSLPLSTESTDAEVKYYKGKNGVKKIYEEALASNEVRSFVNVSEIYQVFPENYSMFDNAYKLNPNIKIYDIVEDSSQKQSLIEFAKRRPTYQYKILPPDMRITAQDILIHDGKVSIINLTDNPHGVLLKNTDLYNNMKMLFDFIWKMIP